MKVKSEVAQSCPTLSDPMDCSPSGSSIQGNFQARVLEWGAIAFSEGKCIDDLIYKAEIESSDIENKCMNTKGGKKGWDELGDWDCHIYTIDTMYERDS